MRERTEEGKKKKLLAFHVSLAVATALSNTSKMNYYLAGRGGQAWSNVVKWVCLKWKGEAGSVYMVSVKGLLWYVLFDMTGITNEYFFPFFFFSALSVYLPLNTLSSSCHLMHHIPLTHCCPLHLSKCMFSFFLFYAGQDLFHRGLFALWR